MCRFGAVESRETQEGITMLSRAPDKHCPSLTKLGRSSCAGFVPGREHSEGLVLRGSA